MRVGSPRRPAPWLARATARLGWRQPLFWQVLIAAAFIAAWQWLPQIPGIRQTLKFVDPFFISSPLRVAKEIWRQWTGADQADVIWPALAQTILMALSGCVAAIVCGAVLGLVCSNWVLLNRIMRPFLVFLNAMPKVALIPVIVLIVGSSAVSNAATAFIVVIFVIFFNAYEGGSKVPGEMLDNARLLGAGWAGLMFKVRWPFVLAWTFAQLPNAIAFALVGTVTAELFTGSVGIGHILIVALNTANADLTFAVVINLAVIGVLLVLGSDMLRRRLLRWWEQ